ncbi:MAG: tetratricopeptide repeat protein, partial [Proteobacteria bacterium]
MSIAKAAPAAEAKNKTLDLQLNRTSLPAAPKQAAPEKKAKSLEAVKPPKSGEFYEGKTKEAEYESLLNQEIATLFKLSRQNKNSPNRGEVWLRLGERYVEKARLMDLRAQADYEKAVKAFNDKKTRIRPKYDQSVAREYNEKAVQLYEWFIRDFPKDPKVDQALFFLGYNQFELGNTERGEQYYKELVTRYPESIFVSESRFALGEYYFENEKWKDALDNYAKVIQAKKARLNTFALYKSAWCLYRLNRTPTALQALERVIKLSRAAEQASSGPGGRAVNKVRLASEAIKDYVPFYGEVGDPKDAEREFMRITGDEKQVQKMLERLAYIYADNGNRQAAVQIFKRLISMNPQGEKAAEYQYQVVLTYVTHDPKQFRAELEFWLEQFGPESQWSRANAKNEKLVGDVAKLQETTVRNHVLQLHQAAQNSRAPFSQGQAHAGYLLYFKHFTKAPKHVEMRFFHAELLYDMGKYEDAAKVYGFVAERDPKGPYAEKAVTNALLALEKNLPSNAEIDKKRGKSVEPMPLDPAVEQFE